LQQCSSGVCTSVGLQKHYTRSECDLQPGPLDRSNTYGKFKLNVKFIFYSFLMSFREALLGA
jgi:hypothetical protein